MGLSELTLLLEEGGPAKTGESRPRQPALSRRDLKLFAISLSRLLAGGIPILKALEAMEGSAKRLALKNFLRTTGENIRQGMGLKEALEGTGAMPGFLPQMIHAGAMSGTVPAVLEEIAGYVEKEETLRRKILEAATYPAFILLMGAVTLGVLLRSVIPKLAAVYQDFGAELPMPTQMVLAASAGFPAFCAAFTGIALILAFFAVKKREAVLALLHKTPFFGGFLKTCALIQFSRLLSLLLASGITVLEALAIAAATFPGFLEQGISRLAEGLAGGRGFSNCLAPVVWMDDLSKMIVASGEESGRLPESFAQIARDSEARLECQVQIFVKLLEPALILAIGLVVGFVVIGTVLPIFDMSGLVK